MTGVSCLGCDPGSINGACVLLNADGRTVEAWWVWQKLTRKGEASVYRVRSIHDDWHRGHIWQVGEIVGVNIRPLSYQLVVEGLFVPKRDGKLKIQTVLTLAEATGELMGGLRYSGTLPVLRPPARTWRPEAAGIPARTQKAEAEAKAIVRADHLFKWPESATELTKAERGARAEAAFLARWGWAQRRVHPELRKHFAKEGR
jgi:hypothetical protein